jgi:hypothetical protein
MGLVLRSRSQQILIQKANGTAELASSISWVDGVAHFQNLEAWSRINVVINVWYQFDPLKGTILRSMRVIDTHTTADDGLVRLMQGSGECSMKQQGPLAR